MKRGISLADSKGSRGRPAYTPELSQNLFEPLEPEYMSLGPLWEDIPNVHKLAESLCPNDTKFIPLHAAQLIKHVLGFKAKFTRDGFRLLYLWYDVLGEEGATHRSEIEVLSEVMKADGVKFYYMSYQDLIAKLSNDYRQKHERYITYLTERYL